MAQNNTGRLSFHAIVRQWCRTYKYMRDSEKNRRFYLTSSHEGLVEMAKNIKPALSPIVMMESVVEGGGPIRRPERIYPVYFFVRASKMADGDAAAVAYEEAWMHCRNFLTWLIAKHEEELETNIDGSFARIDLDNAYLDFVSTDPKEDGWLGVMVQFSREEPLDLCIDEDLYVSEDSSESSSGSSENPSASSD